MSSTSDQIKITQEHDEEEESTAYVHAMQIALATTFEEVLKSAIKLGLLQTIAKSGEGAHLSSSELASLLHTKNPNAPVMLDRMMRLLVSHKVLTCKLRTDCVEDGDQLAERLYGLAPAGKFFVENKDGVSMTSLLLLSRDKVFLDCWDHLNEAIIDGGDPFVKAHGMTMYEYYGTDSRFKETFNKGISEQSTIILKKILETYKGFEGLNSIVDVAGGIGATINMIISEYPSIKGINYDVPHVVENAPAYHGVEHVGGDMFVSVPKADAIFMKRILHNWSDEQNLKTLKNCYEALPDNGKVIVVEFILPELPEPSRADSVVYNMDNIMLTYHSGGIERTEKHIKTLANAAGFSMFQVVCRAYNYWIMEFRK